MYCLFEKLGKCIGVIVHSGHLAESFTRLNKIIKRFPKKDRIQINWRLEINQRGFYKPIIMLVACNEMAVCHLFN